MTWKRCKMEGKLILITNRKSYMSFQLVPKLATLNDLEWPWTAWLHCVISLNLVNLHYTYNRFRARKKVHVRYLICCWASCSVCHRAIAHPSECATAHSTTVVASIVETVSVLQQWSAHNRYQLPDSSWVDTLDQLTAYDTFSPRAPPSWTAALHDAPTEIH